MASASAAGGPPTIAVRHVAAAVVGNWLEFYDFTIYAYFASQIGDAFFPQGDQFTKLMAALITYGVGFICRPIGAVVIGRYADRAGRKPAMLLSFAMMGVALLGLVFVPSYQQIGVAAPVIVVLLRLVQGFALGGEVGPTTAFLVEAAPAGQRGLYGAWQSASQSLSSLSGGLVGVVLAYVLSASALHDYGWRIAFLVGALVLPFGFILRSTLPETMHHAEPQLDAHPESATIRSHWRIILLGLGLITGGTISTYVFVFMTTYAQVTLHMGIQIAFWVTVVNGSAGLFASLLGGWLSDKWGRRPLLIWPRLAFLLATLPVFMFVTQNRSAAVLLCLMGGLNILSNLSGVPALVALTESLRKEIRSVGTATVYAVAVCIFGGTTQPVVAWLDKATGNPLAIAWYLMAATLVALIASLLITETVKPGER
ncbi:MAG TPA: MFS transporter [Caulobacteraceae bacterium]|jgi:MFS family permease|nr:MFS transporter [Caulobacteraceae bacterium]